MPDVTIVPHRLFISSSPLNCNRKKLVIIRKSTPVEKRPQVLLLLLYVKVPLN